ncbi:lysophospholipid acyltransferase family protein [Tateyamaria pelophila]|uniref:lysophospholipid acyltransferase family protein n=1 Tax=Tateyamaria pelophila TaxID=328415 RepID=UPI001CBC035A|nr:lysophospholipid acyltransferase family protein [Tateyamaria pelophila]
MPKKISKRFNPLISALHFAIRRLPAKQATALMAFVLSKAGSSFVKSTNMRRNIQEAFPELEEGKADALANEMLANFGRHIAEVAHIPDFRDGKNGTRIDWITSDGSTFDGKGPVIYVGAHVGSWELSPLLFHQLKQPLTVIYSQNKNPIIENLLAAHRAETGAIYVEKFKALRPCFQALDRSECIALLVDQRVNAGIEVDFFGRTTAITRLPARLATGFNCPIVPFEIIRVAPGHLRVTFQEPILPEGRKGKEAEFDLTQKIANAIEGSITRNASHWFCSKLRWKRADRERMKLQALENATVKPTLKPLSQDEL